MSDFTFDNPTDELIDLLTREKTTLKNRLDEIDQQIETYDQQVKRAETRNADIAATLRTMEDNFDTVPRDDIRKHYEEAIETRFRLATMRGQLEQFKSTKELIQSEQDILQKILTQLRGGGVELSDENDSSGPNGMSAASSSNIIRIVQAQEDERLRLAMQMHDGPAQSLTNFVLQAEICQRMFDSNPEGAREELVNLKEAANITFQRVRDFIADLRPMMLSDLGVQPTVRKYVESFGNKSDIVVKLDLPGSNEDRRLEEYQEVMLFRGVQDLMAHARDFADATEINIRLDLETDHAKVTVQDNGRPFDAEEMLSDDHPDDPRAQGIMTLREKFELINGEVSINNLESGGTEARIEMAISDRE
jgi:two-component system, NarL family, sensor histidine kinase DegS